MNDGFDNNINDAVSDSVSELVGEYQDESGVDTGTEQDITDSDNTVSDSVGNDTILPSDSEVDTENTATDSEIASEIGAEIGLDSAPTLTETGDINYLPELEYIDYLLNEQLTGLKSVTSVSGNSITVSFDDTSSQLLTDIRTDIGTMIEGQQLISTLLTSVLVAVVLEYLFASAKRIMKKSTNRKEL